MARRAQRSSGTGWFIATLIILIILCFGLGVWAYFYFEPAPRTQNTEDNGFKIGKSSSTDLEPLLNPLNPFTGEEDTEYINPTIVMISNIKEARPQTGLYKADIVYEIEMEGGITRFVSLFYGNPPTKAGPVRSARPYVMKFGLEWDTYFVHVGGSEDAKAFAKIPPFRDVDGMTVQQGFSLDNSRKRPHNTYVTFSKLLEGKEENGKFPTIKFKEDDGSAAEVLQIKFDYDKNNRIQYVWDESTRSYARWLNDKPHVDRETGAQIYAKNVIIQYAKHTFSGDKLGHIDVEVVGTGKTEYYIGGKYATGSWHKESDGGATVYLDETGNEIVRIKGNTFVQVLRDTFPMVGTGNVQ